MNKQVDMWIDEHFPEMLEDLRQNITFPSVFAPSAGDGAPFGEASRKALEHALRVAQKLGFETKNLDGYAGYAEYGQGEESLGVLSHLDVVPAGTGWDCDPFEGQLLDDRIVGRGTRDDKGPAFCAMYALAAVKNCGIPLRRKVRLIMGCNEECGMMCMDHYLKHEQPPTLSFSPDAEYPLVNAEKSSYYAIFKKSYPSQIQVKAGVAANMIPGTAEAVVPLDQKLVADKAAYFSAETGYCIDVCTVDDGTRIEVTGKQGHSASDDGKNALQGLFAFLWNLPLNENDHVAIDTIYRSFGLERYGESLGLDMEDPTGRTLVNLPIVEWDDGGYRLQIDIRCPVSLKKEALDNALLTALSDAEAELLYYSPGLYVAPEDELVKNLLKVYEERSSIPAEPKRCSGGTYARKLPNAVAFGVEYEGSGSGAHQANEFARYEELKFNAKMIADAIIALAGSK